MGTIYRFIEEPGIDSEILKWFGVSRGDQSYSQIPDVISLYLREPGETTSLKNKNSPPLLDLYLPRVVRNMFWSVGEVHFLPNHPKSQHPELHAIRRSFGDWLKKRECVFPARLNGIHDWDRQFLGSAKDYESPVYALSSGLTGLECGRQFVSIKESDAMLDDVCSKINPIQGVQ